MNRKETITRSFVRDLGITPKFKKAFEKVTPESIAKKNTPPKKSQRTRQAN